MNIPVYGAGEEFAYTEASSHFKRLREHRRYRGCVKRDHTRTVLLSVEKRVASPKFRFSALGKNRRVLLP